MRAAGIDPLLRIAHELRVDREPRREHLARGFGRGAQPLERGPRPLGVHMVDGDGGDATPVVDAGGEQRREVVAEIGRRLQVHVVRQHDARGRDRPEELLRRTRGCLVHRGAELRQEVLDDHLLHVTVPAVRGRDRFQCFQPLGARLADPDEDAGGERDARPPRRFERREPAFRRLVGGAVVRAAGLAEARRERLDHHPLGRAHRPEPLQLGLRQCARVGVGEQPGLVEHEPGNVREVADRGVVSVGAQPLGRVGIARLGVLSEGEQRLVATELGAAARDVEHGFRGEVRRVEAGRRLGERAVAAAVAAQHRQRDEDLRRERDARAERGVAPARRLGEEVVEGKVLQRGVQHVGHELRH